MTWQHNLDAISRGDSQQALDLLFRGRGCGGSAGGTGTPTSKNIFSSPAGATEISILAGLPPSFLNECGVPTGMLANIPALAMSRWSPINKVIS
jgi:hypothetical protein